MTNRFSGKKLTQFVKQKILNFNRRFRYLVDWGQILWAGRPSKGSISVSYGYPQLPEMHESVKGGIIKFQRMQTQFPNAWRRFNILYLGSSSLPKDWIQQLWLAKRKGAKVVLNQNGVGYPAWCGEKYKSINQPMASILHNADYIFYQSEFCKSGADGFLGNYTGKWEILYNAVDTNFFSPLQQSLPNQELVILLGGNQYQQYRLETALRAVAFLLKYRKNVKLLVAGSLNWSPDRNAVRKTVAAILNELDIGDHVEFIGTYAQKDAPDIYRRAHILLHTKYNDPCSSTVIEAMACGLPVVYSQSGGTPELVGATAGIGIPSKQSWEYEYPPDPKELATALICIAEQHSSYSEAARQRAVQRFDLQSWLQRHQMVFHSLTK